MSRLFLLYAGSLHAQALHVCQKEVLILVDIPLLAFFNGFDEAHSHDLYPKTCLATDGDDSLVDFGEIESFDALDDGLDVVEVLCGPNFICFGEDDLHVNVVPFASLQELYVIGFESMF